MTVFPIRYEDQPEEVWTVDPSLFPKHENYERRFPVPHSAAIADPVSTEKVVAKELESIRGLLSNSETRELKKRLRPALKNARLKAAQVFSVYQETALVGSCLARDLPDNPASRLLIRRVCERLLAKRGIQRAVPLEQVDELYERATSDSPDAPDSLWEWILDHARPATEDVS